MYPISETAKAMYDRNYRQVILIRMDTEEDTYTLTENDIIAGSFSIDRYSITGNRIEIGTACAGECKFKIKNYDNRWDSVRFEGAQLFIRIGIADWTVPGAESNVIWMPCGYFTVDKPVKNASILSIEALDRMAKLDKPVDWSMFTGSFNPRTLISRICDLCDVIVYDGASLTSLPNANYVVSLPTDTDITYRNLLQSACMLLGACAFFNENGLLAIKWYNTTNVTIDETKRYSHTIQENNITITGIVYVDTLGEEDVEYISGTKDYAIDISDNPLVGSNIQSVVDALGNALNGFTYRPYSASIKPSPYLYPTDIITFVKNNVSYVGIVSNVTYGINSTTSIEGRGETEEDNGYATYGNFTNVQSKIIEYANKKIDREVTDRTMLLMNLNEMIMNSLGLYETTLQPVPGGGWQYYFHDAPRIGDSTIIYTFGANGFAWTDDWNDGNPVWKYGITRDGNAIVNMLSAYKISADIITAGTMRAVNLIFGQDPNTTELRTNDAKTGALFEGTGVMQFETKGEFFAQNLDSNEYEANHITLTNNATESSAEMYNYFNNIRSNDIDFTGRADYNRTFIVNNRVGQNLNASNIRMNADSSTYALELQNYNFNYTTATGGVTSANRISLKSSGASNAIELLNKNSSATDMNFVKLQHFPNNDWNRLLFQNNWVGGTVSNWIQCSNAGETSDFQFYNYHYNGNLANTFYMTTNSNVSKLELTNRDSDGSVQGALYIQKGTNGSNSVFLYNYHENGNVANNINMTSSSNAGSLTIANRDSSGNTRTSLSVASNGTYDLSSSVGSSNSAVNSHIRLNTNGNLDVIGNNVVYIGTTRGAGYLSLSSKNYRGDVYWTQVSNIQNSQYVLVADSVVNEGKS